MRHSSGAISGVVVTKSGGRDVLDYVSSTNDGREWTHFTPKSIRGLSDSVTQPALDGNDQGVYVSYVAGSRGHVLSILGAPSHPVYRDSGDLTGAGKNQYSFIAASRNGFKTVAYGWFDRETGAINVGVSPDGKTFPRTRHIAFDKDALYGPALGVLGQYVIVSYLTRNPRITGSQRVPGSAAVAWVESSDGGRTWSSPSALYGSLKSISASVTDRGVTKFRLINLANAVPKIADFSQSLVWADFTMANSRVFVSSTLQYTIPWSGRTGSIGVVSFKMPKSGGEWTHVAAGDVVESGSAPNTWLHQYSALPDTPIRAVSYIEHVGQRSQSGEELVVAVSTDTGKTFDHFVRYGAVQLGLSANSKLLARTSPCLWRDASGKVSIDAFVSAGNDMDSPSTVAHLKLPLGLNIKGHVVAGSQTW